MKTVIFVWSQEFNIDKERLEKYNYLCEKKFNFGLGQLINATIKLFNLSKIMEFTLIVDIQLHPVSLYLKNEPHEYSGMVYKNKDNIDYVCYGEVENYIEKSNSDILYIFTNDFYEGEITNECKEFIKRILSPNDKFSSFIEEKIKTIPYEYFNIMHFRINDSEIIEKKPDTKMNNLIKNIRDAQEEKDVFITDNKFLKNLVFLNTDIFMFDTKICHLGLSKKIDEIRDTLFEFFLITKSSKIKTYCRIQNISRFVKWASIIYDIPIVSI
jgi:hypothetical protein